MNKFDLARQLARQSHRSRAKAADDVDALVHRLLKELKVSDPTREVEDAAILRAPVPRPRRES